MYSGSTLNVIPHFSETGFNCPLGFNIADYLIDLTMHAIKPKSNTQPSDSPLLNIKELQDSILFTPRPTSPDVTSSPPQVFTMQFHQEQTELTIPETITNHLNILTNGYLNSQVYKNLLEMMSIMNTSSVPQVDAKTRSIASLSTQFKILTERAFKNIVRNPSLLQTHYVMSVLVAISCGILFYKVTDDISGFQYI